MQLEVMMEVRLVKEQYYVDEEGKFKQKEALRTTGMKAAVCFKPGNIKPWEIGDLESDDVLVKRGVSTIVSDHVTPSQQVPVSIEAYDIPKVVCMYLENIGMQAADERSLRYTEFIDVNGVSDVEIRLYNKWLKKIQDVLWKDYANFFLRANQNDEKKAKNAIKKIAQENARFFLSIKVTTALTYTSNLAELNKVALQIEKLLKSEEKNEFEQMAAPFLDEFYNKLKELKILLTNNDIWNIAPEVARSFKLSKDDNLVYHDPKSIDLNLLTEHNKFITGSEDEFGISFNATRPISLAGYAQFERHRTIRTSISIPSDYNFFVPKFIEAYDSLAIEWIRDSLLVQKVFPQGQLIDMSLQGSIYDLVTYVGGERACTRAQEEITSFYLSLLEDYYNGLKDTKPELASVLKPYVNKYRCQSGCYKCLAPCPGGPRVKRKF